MTPSSRYHRFARLYQDLFEKTAPDSDLRFYRDRIAPADDPVLEPACGAGRLMAPLIEAGHFVHGVDKAAPMIVLAKKRMAAFGPGRFALTTGSMTDFDLERKDFGTAVLANNAIGYLLTENEKRQAIRNAGAHLRPGGMLWIDRCASIQSLVEAGCVDSGPIRYENNEGGGTFHTIMRYDPASGQAEECLRYDWTDLGGKRITGEDCDRFSFLDPSQLIELVAAQGFCVDYFYGDFDGSAFTTNSGWLILGARRK